MRARKNIIKLAAKIYAANLISNAMGSGADSELMSQDERDYMEVELQKISNKIIKGITAPTLDDCISQSIKLINERH